MDARRRRWIIGGAGFIGIWPLLCILVIAFGFFSLTPLGIDWPLLTYYGKTELVVPASEGYKGGTLSPHGRYMVLGWWKYGKGLRLWDTRSGAKNPRLLFIADRTDTGRWLNEETYIYRRDQSIFLVHTDRWLVEPLPLNIVTDSSHPTLTPDQRLSLREQWKTAKMLYVLPVFGYASESYVVAESSQRVLSSYYFTAYGPPAMSDNVLFQDLPAVDVTDQSYTSGLVGNVEGYPSRDETLAAIAPSRQGTIRLVDQQQRTRAMASHLVGYPLPIGWSEDGQSFYFQILTNFSAVPGYTAIFKISPLSPLQQTWVYLHIVLAIVALIGAVWWWRRRRKVRALQNETTLDSA